MINDQSINPTIYNLHALTFVIKCIDGQNVAEVARIKLLVFLLVSVGMSTT